MIRTLGFALTLFKIPDSTAVTKAEEINSRGGGEPLVLYKSVCGGKGGNDIKT